MRTAPALAAAGALAVALGLSACSTGGPATPSGGAAAPSSTAASAPATGSTGSGTGTPVDGGRLAQRVADAMTAARSGTATITTTAPGLSFDATSSFTANSAGGFDTTGTTTVGEMRLEVRQVGSTVYLKGFPSELTGGRTWARVDEGGSDPLGKQLSEATQNGPQQLVEQLRGTTVTQVGSNGGVTTYEVSGLEVQGLSDGTMRLAVDDQGRPQTSTVTAQGVEVTVTYSGWGDPVSVSAPPADEVGALSIPSGLPTG